MSAVSDAGLIERGLEHVAESIHALGNAGAYNNGQGGQGAIEVLGYQVGRIADALESIAAALTEEAAG